MHSTTRRADDLIPEENPTVLLALKRLPPKEAYDRVFRMRRAFQVGFAFALLYRSGLSRDPER
jgi:ubiquinol-cytochrome c reductase subunit 7